MSAKKSIAIYIRYPISDIECALALNKVCKKKFKTAFLNHKTLVEKNLKNFDCIAFPGGLGEVDNFDFLLRDKKDLIKNYLNSGGKYLGICMGAYIAGKHYFDLLKDADCIQYVKRKNSEIKQEEEKKIIKVFWKRKLYNMYFYDGCAIIGNEKKFTIYSRYKNKDPMAIIQNNIGLMGCHPESPLEWYKELSMESFYNKNNHKLLIDFIEDLFAR